MLTNPIVRVVVRAVLAGLGAFLASIQAADSYGAQEWVTAAIAGLVVAVALASAELGTPLNPTVGVGKEGGK